MSVRVRFAPSPTGHLHIGNARSGLYNWLFATANRGVMILRSDDTDVERGRPEYYDDIIDGLRWLGLEWQEGIEVGGPHAPYKQSERLDRYRDVVGRLIESGDAYRCFCTPGELDAKRQQAMKEGRPPGYDGTCRDRTEAPDGDVPHSVRFAVGRPGETVFEDVVRGRIHFDHDSVEDFVILRSNGFPTYHLASSVDDVDFRITHVVRGEDILSSTPKHILLGRAVAADAGVPFDITYAHLSLLLGPDGKKLSKRHGDTALRSYREAGYLPEAMVNYLALLGWSPGDDETIVSRDAMIQRFDLTHVLSSPAIFDVDKLQWMNGVYIRELDSDDFLARVVPLVEADLEHTLTTAEHEVLAEIGPLVQERVRVLTEVPEQVRFLFVDSVVYDDASWEKVMTKPEAIPAVTGAIAALEGLEPWTHESIESVLRDMLAERELKVGKGLQPIRVAVSGSSVSPPLFESLDALGVDRTLTRLKSVAERLEA